MKKKQKTDSGKSQTKIKIKGYTVQPIYMDLEQFNLNELKGAVTALTIKAKSLNKMSDRTIIRMIKLNFMKEELKVKAKKKAKKKPRKRRPRKRPSYLLQKTKRL